PTIPDIYTRTAAQLSHIPIAEVTKPIRQRGKVVELALGFLGGVGALHAMAAGYGIHFTDAEAANIVSGWRAANPWAAEFGEDLWDGMMRAWQVHGKFVPVGRCGFIFLPGLLGGS